MQNYSYDDFTTAQRRAETEAREMFARACNHGYGVQAESSNSSFTAKRTQNEENIRQPFILPNPLGNLLNGLFKDSDTLLILALVILLASDKADKLLIFALIYIMI